MISRYQSQYSVRALCDFFQVSPSGYYAYLKRKDQDTKDEKIASLIAMCQDKYRKTYGYRRVSIWLQQNYGLLRNPKTILRIMRKYGLLSVMRRKKKYQKMSEHLHRYENLLNRDFKTDRRDHKWVTDISYIQTPEGTCYLSIIRDLCDNHIVSYQVSTEQTLPLVLDTLHLAMKRKKVTGELILHSDQGFQYTSRGYNLLTKQYGITPSMSRRGNCYDNAMAENFFSILKTECIHPTKPQTISEARLIIDEFIYFYNYERIQLKTGQAPLSKGNLS